MEGSETSTDQRAPWKRSLSFTEISTSQTCQFRWDLAYGGHTVGATLHRRQLAPLLSDGRAWGAAVAAWHATPEPTDLAGDFSPLTARWRAHEALIASYRHDHAEQVNSGIMADLVLEVERSERLADILDHYTQTAVKLRNLTRLEGEIDVPIPSRAGRQASTRYHFQCFLDGFTVDEVEHEWLVEYKLRRQLTPASLIQIGRQPRWYAWARQRESDRRIVGVIIDKRLNEAPKPPRILKSGKPSHDKAQVTTPELYVAVCEELGEDPHDDVVAALGARRWQQRVPLLFGPRDLDEAGQELVSAARLIRDLDGGTLTPIRNAQSYICSGCQFKDICAAPTDEMFVSTHFDYTVPKRMRVPDPKEKA